MYRLPPALGRVARITSGTRIIGTPFPGVILRYPGGGTWYADGVSTGVTGETYTVPVTAVGKVVTCGRSTPVRVWHPDDITLVDRSWLPWNGRVYNSMGPDVPAADGETVRGWLDTKGGYYLENVSGAVQPVFRSTGGPGGLPCVEFSRALTTRLTQSLTSAGSGDAYGWLLAYNWTEAGQLIKDGQSSNYILGISTTNADVKRVQADTPVSWSYSAGVSGTWYSMFLEANYLSGTVLHTRDTTTLVNSSSLPTGAFTVGPDTRVGGDLAANTYLTGNIVALVRLRGSGSLSTRDRNRLRQFMGLCAGKNLGLPIT